MPKKKSDEYFHEWARRIILENYQRYNQSREKSVENYHESKRDHKLIQFIGYNGPTVSIHATKKLITPLMTVENQDFNDLDQNSRDEFRDCFLNLTLNEINTHFTNLKDFNSNDFTYNLTSKLGVTYFSGRGVNLRINYSLKDVLNIIDGIRVDNVQKGAKMNSSFNSNKGVNDQIEFENFLRRKKFKFIEKCKSYSLKLYNHAVKEEIDIELDEHFHLVSITNERAKIFNIDYLRDRRKSFDKTSGT